MYRARGTGLVRAFYQLCQDRDIGCQAHEMLVCQNHQGVLPAFPHAQPASRFLNVLGHEHNRIRLSHVCSQQVISVVAVA